MKKTKGLLLLTFVIMTVGVFSSCGGGSTPPVSVTATLSPVNAATGKVAGVAVTATFSAAITEPAVWTDVLSLKKNNEGANLCTSVTYDATAMVATCVHSVLTFGSSYTVALAGVSGVTDPLPVTFSTSSFFGGVTSTGTLVSINFNVAAGTATVTNALTGEVFGTGSYVVDPADPAKYILGGRTDIPAYIAGDFMTIPVDNNVVFYGVLIDPNQTNLDYMKGNQYGAVTMHFLNNDIVYVNSDVGADTEGTILFEGSSSIADQPTVTDAGLTIDSYLLDQANYYFSQTGTKLTNVDVIAYSNEDGYAVERADIGDDIAQIFLFNQDPVSGDIPAGISVGDVYNGYLSPIGLGTIEAFSLTVTSVDGTSIGLSLLAHGDPQMLMAFSNVTTPAEWGTGFYATADNIFVIRILGSNGIAFTFSEPPLDFGFGLALKQ